MSTQELCGFLAEERKKLIEALALVQAQRQESENHSRLHKRIAKLCRQVKKDNNPEILREIVELLEKMRDYVSTSEIDKNIAEYEKLISAFNLVMDHFGFVAEQKKPQNKVMQTDVLSPDFGYVIPKQMGKHGNNKERLEILKSIVLSHSKDNFAPLDVVFQEFISKVAVPAGFGCNHLGLCLYKLGLSWSRKKNKIFPLRSKPVSNSKMQRNYRNKILAIFLSLGQNKEFSRDKIYQEAKRLGLVGNKKDWERFMMYLHKHCNYTLQANKIFKIVKGSVGSGKKATGATFALTPLGTKLLSEYRQELQALLGDKIGKKHVEKGE